MQERPRQYRFGACVLDMERGCLLRGGTRVDLRPKAYDTLVYLVSNRGRLVGKDELSDAIWPKTVVTDDSLVKVVRDVRNAIGDDGHCLIRTVPRRGYVFELESSGDADDGRHRTRWAREWRLFAGAATAAVAASLAIGAYLPQRPSEPDAARVPRSVAVLPFDNLSAEPDSEYFAAGVHDSILTHLSKIGDLHTIARTSMLRYTDSMMPIGEIARELNVKTILEGTVRYAGDRVRITAQLIDAETNMHVWSEEYDRPLADIFAIQTDIARQIAAALDAELSRAEVERLAKPVTESTEAYELYLRGRYHWDKTETAELEKGIEYFKQAIQLAPEFALAYAGLADSYTILGALGAAPPSELEPKARAAADRALTLDPALAEAYVARAMLAYFYDWDYERGNAGFERAIALNPSLSIAHHLYGKNIIVEKRFDESLASLKRALSLDPYSERIHLDVGQTLFMAGRFEEAIAAFTRSGELDPGSLPVQYWLMRCHEQLGRRDLAIAAHLTLNRSRRWSADGVPAADRIDLDRLERIYDETGWRAYWQAWIAMLTKLSLHRHIEPYRFIEAHTRVGDYDSAFEWLETALTERSAWFPFVYIDPLMRPLYDDPRFDDLMRRSELYRYHASEASVATR